MNIESIVEKTKSSIENFKQKNKDWIIIIYWPSWIWKTKLWILMNDFFDIEIISADSRQIYKYLDIWTDKVSIDLRQKIVHHQIDIVQPDVLYTAWQWQNDTKKIIKKVYKKNKLPIILWWTGLYIDTIYKNFDMPAIEPDFEFRNELMKKEVENNWFLFEYLKQIDPEESIKINSKSLRHIVRAIEIYEKTWIPKSKLIWTKKNKTKILMIWINWKKELLNIRIDKRIQQMFEDWLIEEIKKILWMWFSKDLQSLNTIWYKETIEYLEWKIDLEKCKEKIRFNTHRFAKRQRTWFRRYVLDKKLWNYPNVDYIFFEL